jgi:hypothetical protein
LHNKILIFNIFEKKIVSGSRKKIRFPGGFFFSSKNTNLNISIVTETLNEHRPGNDPNGIGLGQWAIVGDGLKNEGQVSEEIGPNGPNPIGLVDRVKPKLIGHSPRGLVEGSRPKLTVFVPQKEIKIPPH